VLPPGWSLAYEAVFYSLFTLVLFAPARWRFGLLAAGLFAISIFGMIDPPYYGLWANPMMLQFAAGAWLARRQLTGHRIEPGAGAIFAGLGVAGFVIMGLTGLRSELFRPLLWGLPALCLVMGAVALEPVFRAPKPLIVLGDASYAIYLTHLMVIAAVAHLMGPDALPGLLPVFVPAALAASIAVGLAFHVWIERPLIAGARALPRLWQGLTHRDATAAP
jgi:exopolysaccharide production protein ExoZ